MDFYEIENYIKCNFPYFNTCTTFIQELCYVIEKCQLFDSYNDYSTFYLKFYIKNDLVLKIRALISQYWDHEWFLLNDKQTKYLKALIILSICNIKLN